MKVNSLDHFVLTVKDLEATVTFYEKILGMDKLVFGDNRYALQFGQQKINLHELGNEFEPKAQNVMSGSADLCFITDTPIAEVMAHLSEHKVEIAEGPVKRTGAVGDIMSVYFRDPDLNLIEVSNYM